MVPDMNFTRDSLGKNMGSSRERHEKHMGKTWEFDGRFTILMVWFIGEAPFFAGLYFIPNSYIQKPRPELRTGCTRIAQQLRGYYRGE